MKTVTLFQTYFPKLYIKMYFIIIVLNPTAINYVAGVLVSIIEIT